VQPVTNEPPVVEKNDEKPRVYKTKISFPSEYDHVMKDKFLSIYHKITDLEELTKEEFTQIESFDHNQKCMIIKKQNECIHGFLRDFEFIRVKPSS
jgi:hypothetical protein